MPRKRATPCSHSACPRLTHERYCEQHFKAEDTRYRRYQRDPKTNARYGSRWRKIRAAYVAEHPLREACLDAGCYTPAAEVHLPPPRPWWHPRPRQPTDLVRALPLAPERTRWRQAEASTPGLQLLKNTTLVTVAPALTYLKDGHLERVRSGRANLNAHARGRGLSSSTSLRQDSGCG